MYKSTHSVHARQISNVCINLFIQKNIKNVIELDIHNQKYKKEIIYNILLLTNKKCLYIIYTKRRERENFKIRFSL
jgi:hypothetical protein